jgi:hypothetical protein
MEISQRLLCLLFLASFGVGIALGCVYDLLRMSRMLISPVQTAQGEKVSPPSRKEKWQWRCLLILLFAEDVLFALLCGFVLILLSYFLNDGQIRWISPVGMVCGFFAYGMTVGKLIRKLLDCLAKGIRKVVGILLGFLWKVLSVPLIWLYRLARRWLLDPVRVAWKKHRENVKLRREAMLMQDSTEAQESVLEEK